MDKLKEFEEEIKTLTLKYNAKILAIIVIPSEVEGEELIGIVGNMCMVCGKEGIETFIELHSLKHDNEKEIVH